MVLWSDEQQEWLLPAPADGRDSTPDEVGGSAPVTVLRYVERVREPLVVADARGDDRFARDPSFAASGACSLLALPVLSRGALRAVLVLENRLMRGAFTAERLDAVKLIAGQLAVSLENAQVYAELRRTADELAASRARIVATGDETRRRIVRDLHDGAQNRLVQVASHARAGRTRARGRPRRGGRGAVRPGRRTGPAGQRRSPRAVARDPAERPRPRRPRRRRRGSGRPGRGAAEARLTSDRFWPEIESNLYFVVAEALTNMRNTPARKAGRSRSGPRSTSCISRSVTTAWEARTSREGVSAGLPTASPRSEAACGSRVLLAAARGSLPRSRWSGEGPGRRRLSVPHWDLTPGAQGRTWH